jgi:hypothetical protein
LRFDAEPGGEGTVSQEDALFRALRSAVDRLLADRRRTGTDVIAGEVAERAIDEFRDVVELEEHAAALRTRLSSYIEELARR